MLGIDPENSVRTVRSVRTDDNALKNKDLLATPCGRYADAATLPTVRASPLKANDKTAADAADGDSGVPSKWVAEL